jgi:hypothetical protein
MGISLRIFLVTDDESLQRLALSRYERLLRRDTAERLPQYAGKRMRYASVVLRMVNRKPSEIIQIQYSLLKFDLKGMLDPAEQERKVKLALEVLPPLPTERKPPQIIDARHQFARRRYDNNYKWKPSPELEAAIVDAIFAT